MNLGPTQELPVAVDVAGGDRGVAVIVEGAVKAYRELGIRTILVGPEDDITAVLQSLGAFSKPAMGQPGPAANGKIICGDFEIVHAPSIIEMHESPSRAVRRKPDSSLCTAYRIVEEGRASSIISAGNSGAMMAAGAMICGLMPGIERPAIAALIPVVGDGHPTVILDCGANVECHARNLVQFAIMGGVYCSSLFSIYRPKIALLSNGAEPSKGTAMIREASAILGRMDTLHYVGFVEGRDVATGTVDVIVCDGFVGNVLLKVMEGCAHLIANHLKQESRNGLFSRFAMGIAAPVLRRLFREKFDYAAYGGAPLLGLRKLGIVLHGSSDERAVRNALRVAQSFSGQNMTERIQTDLLRLEENIEGISGDNKPFSCC